MYVLVEICLLQDTCVPWVINDLRGHFPRHGPSLSGLQCMSLLCSRLCSSSAARTARFLRVGPGRCFAGGPKRGFHKDLGRVGRGPYRETGGAGTRESWERWGQLCLVCGRSVHWVVQRCSCTIFEIRSPDGFVFDLVFILIFVWMSLFHLHSVFPTSSPPGPARCVRVTSAQISLRSLGRQDTVQIDFTTVGQVHSLFPFPCLFSFSLFFLYVRFHIDTQFILDV